MRKEIVTLIIVGLSFISCLCAPPPSLEDHYPIHSKQWQYTSEYDLVTGKTIEFLTVNSMNQVSLAFPYEGPQQGRLQLRKHPYYGTDVLFGLRKGQIISCQAHNKFPMLVRVDDQAVQEWPCVRTSDGSTEIVFVSKTEEFIHLLESAKSTVVTVVVYRHGHRAFQFDTTHFTEQLKQYHLAVEE